MKRKTQQDDLRSWSQSRPRLTCSQALPPAIKGSEHEHIAPFCQTHQKTQWIKAFQRFSDILSLQMSSNIQYGNRYLRQGVSLFQVRRSSSVSVSRSNLRKFSFWLSLSSLNVAHGASLSEIVMKHQAGAAQPGVTFTHRRQNESIERQSVVFIVTSHYTHSHQHICSVFCFFFC